ncbi:MAG TPA: hypothetical protein VMW50_03690 [Dehalococcoidia bacterium]|nr:hypothetical protein [Dehalococcoidia bacterium]
MGIFDFLSSDTAATDIPGQVPPATETSTSGKLLTDPNFLRLLAGMGSGFSKGLGAGEAIGGATTEMIRNQQVQKAGGNILKQLLGGGTTIPTPTPRGMAGPDAVTTKRTADGTTTTVQEPSAANLSSYGTNVPAENMSAKGGAVEQSPFWKALLQ